MKTLFESIYAHYAEDPIADSVNGIYNTEAPPNAAFPYIVFSLVSDIQETSMSSVIENCLIQFNIFSNTNSSEEACDIFELLKGDVNEGEGFDFYELLVDNYTNMVLRREQSFLTRDSKIWQYNVVYRIMLLSTGETPTARFVGNFYNLLSI